MLHFWQIPQSLLVQTRLNLWDQSVPDGKITFWSTSRRRVSNRRLVARKQPHLAIPRKPATLKPAIDG